MKTLVRFSYVNQLYWSMKLYCCLVNVLMLVLNVIYQYSNKQNYQNYSMNLLIVFLKLVDFLIVLNMKLLYCWILNPNDLNDTCTRKTQTRS